MFLKKQVNYWSHSFFAEKCFRVKVTAMIYLADEALNNVAKQQRVLIIKPIQRITKPCAWYCFSCSWYRYRSLKQTIKCNGDHRKGYFSHYVWLRHLLGTMLRSSFQKLCTIERFIIEANSVCENNHDSWLTVKKLIGAIWFRSFAYLSYSCTHLSSSDYCYVFNHNIPDGRGGKTSAELLGEASHSVCDLTSGTSVLKQARLGNQVEGRHSRVQPWWSLEPITADYVIIKGPATIYFVVCKVVIARKIGNIIIHFH